MKKLYLSLILVGLSSHITPRNEILSEVLREKRDQAERESVKSRQDALKKMFDEMFERNKQETEKEIKKSRTIAALYGVSLVNFLILLSDNPRKENLTFGTTILTGLALIINELKN